jgi:hypothetical protein
MVDLRRQLDEHFTGDDLDRAVWVPNYLPQWSSRAESAATYAMGDGELRLSIPPEQGLWCADTHDEPLRVSCIQSGVFAGPLGSPVGQLRFRDDITVREEQPTMWGYTPLYGRVDVRMRGTISPRSMFAFWMSGIEDDPSRCGEICVAEVFGDAVEAGSAGVGLGIKRFRDAALDEDFAVRRVDIDVADNHTYGVDWRLGSIDYLIDGEVVAHSDQAPDYPLQLFIGVFDFPAKADPDDDTPVPELIVSSVTGRPPS